MMLNRDDYAMLAAFCARHNIPMPHLEQVPPTGPASREEYEVAVVILERAMRAEDDARVVALDAIRAERGVLLDAYRNAAKQLYREAYSDAGQRHLRALRAVDDARERLAIAEEELQRARRWVQDVFMRLPGPEGTP